jgi:hypothetical protein
MAIRRFLPVLAVPAVAAALLGGVPAAAGAASAGPASPASGPLTGPLTPALVARLSQHVTDPVIVVMKNQFGKATAGTTAARVRAASVTANQSGLLSELTQVHAVHVRQYTLVNSVAATVSAAEAQRLAANPAVEAVIPDATVRMPAPQVQAPVAPTSPARTTNLPLHNVPGACAPSGSSTLAPEGLSLTGTASASAKQPTARSLGITGAGVKVAFIADGVATGDTNFKRASGKSVFIDYQDFTGAGPASPTFGGEAFLDANTIAGQGLHVYNVNGFSAQSYAGTCNVKIQGVAPGASLIGLDIFSGDPSHPYVTTNSMIAEAINYAVQTDHVNVINESFGSNPFPDSTVDVIKLFDDAAVAAGVVVSASTGDSGTTSTVGSPATDPNVISAGASTQFQAYAQANLGGARYFATSGWLSDNISSISSAGFTQSGGTVDLVAPGDLSWASCSTNVAKYSDCTNNVGNPTPIESAGGTSEAAPFVSGAAALVIQAYRKTHGGATPAPALVKQILLSTATDLGTPAQEQGAGLLNSYKAVQLAESVGRSGRTGQTLLLSASQLNFAGLPGSKHSWKVTVTNNGWKPQAVKLSGRALGADLNVQHGTVTLNDSKSNQFTYVTGAKENYAVFHFTVPPGRARLDASIAYPADLSKVSAPLHLTLVDPKGRLAAYSLPQGLGNYGNVDVRVPQAGTWTGVIFGLVGSGGGYTGNATWQVATQRFIRFGWVSATSFTLSPGASRAVTVQATAPAAPGDAAAAFVLSSNLSTPVSIPVTARGLVNLASGGAFSGVLTGGNGRPPGVAQTNYYQFNVPAGLHSIAANIGLANDPANEVAAYLVSPDGNVQGYGMNIPLSGIPSTRLSAFAVNPAAGRWTLIVTFVNQIVGNEVSDAFTGHIRLNVASVSAPKLPNSPAIVVTAAKLTVPVTIKNTSNATQDYFFDARGATAGPVVLTPLAGSSSVHLPMSFNDTPPEYFMPSEASQVTVAQTSTVPAMVDFSPIAGDPIVASAAPKPTSLCGPAASISYTAPGAKLTPGLWLIEPTECGPYKTLAPIGQATDTITVQAAPFDPAVDVSVTGDLMQLAINPAAGSTANFIPVELVPGQTAVVNVVISPSAATGTNAGTLYVDATEPGVPPYGQIAADEVAALPYSYTNG